MSMGTKFQAVMKKLFDNRVFLLFLALVSSFILAEQCSVSFLNRGYPGIDSSVFRYVAYAFSKGQIPYLDSFDHKGPFIYLINYLGQLIHPQVGVWLFELLAICITTVFLYKCAKQVCKDSFLAAVSTFISLSLLNSYLDGGNLTEEYAMPLIAIAIYLFGKYFLENKSSPWELLICGLCGGLVLMLRPNMAVAWLVFPVFVLIHELKQKKYMRLVRYCVWFAIGVLIAISPFLVFFAYNGALADFWDVYIRFNSQYAGEATLTTFAKTVLNFLSPVVVIALVVALFDIFSEKFELKNIAYFLLLLVSLLALSMSGYSFHHYGMILIPACAYPIGSLLSKYRRDERFCRISLSALVAILILSSWLQPTLNCAKHVYRGVYTASDKNLNNVVSFIKDHTEESDKIQVIGNNDKIYFLSGRLAASRYSYQSPIASVDETIYDEFYAEIGENNPKAIITYTQFQGITEFLDAYAYTPVYSSGSYQVYMQSQGD